jgi:serine/threonine protein kinase
MKAEALLGTVLGNCTIQQLIGQGGMGAVYLAQQERPRRQVAVKVLMPASPLKPHQLSAFLERFRRETDAAASLEHPHIMPVYEYGERGGLAYLVMPYISAGTLRESLAADRFWPGQSCRNRSSVRANPIDGRWRAGRDARLYVTGAGDWR